MTSSEKIQTQLLIIIASVLIQTLRNREEEEVLTEVLLHLQKKLDEEN